MNHKLLPFLLAMTFIGVSANASTKSKLPKGKIPYATVESHETPEPDAMVNSLKSANLCTGVKEMKRFDLLLPAHHRNGIDISHYQGHVNWEEVAKEEIGYVYLKATEGASLVDGTYERNLSEARRVGLKVGSYHFYSSRIPIEEQFNNLTQHIHPEKQDLIPLIDVETRGKLPHSEFVANLRRFLAMVEEAYGTKPIIYTYQNFYNKYLVGEIPEYKLMIACYKFEQPQLNDDKEYVMWQFTQTGRVNGIRGAVDRSMLIDDHSLSEILM